MQAYQQEFLQMAVEREVLRFGQFTLKSGRVSPYFFNAGLFDSGATLAALGRFYAQAIREAGLQFDMLFGPAYKGIPLVAATATALAREYGLDFPYCFNRKEAKGHGEGGKLVGAPPAGRVLIVDDVITAGTAIGEAVEIIREAGATPVGVAIALDRQERGRGSDSAVREVEKTHGLQVISIANLDAVIAWLGQQANRERQLIALSQYREQYGIYHESQGQRPGAF